MQLLAYTLQIGNVSVRFLEIHLLLLIWCSSAATVFYLIHFETETEALGDHASAKTAQLALGTIQHCPDIAVVKIPFRNSCIRIVIRITTKI